MLMHHVTVTTAAGANSNRSTQPSTSANMVEGVPAGEPPPHPRILTSSPGGVLVSGPTAMTTHESTTATTAQPTNARAATLSALGSSVGSSGGGMSDSGFAASISSGFGPGSSSTGSTTGAHVTVGPNKPDLSHLTAEERAIIENVIHRHHTEENKEYEFLR